MHDTNIYLIRHGESVANATTQDQIGQDKDTDLTEKGILQAEKLANRFKHIKVDAIYSSMYPRAQRTARIFQKNIDYHGGIKYTDALVEYNPGDWKGKKRGDLYSDVDNMRSMGYLNMGFLFPNGESYHQVERRAASFLEDAIIYNENWISVAKKHETHIPIFSHGMTIKCLLRYVMGCDQSFMWKIRIGNTSVSHLVYNDRGWFLNSINDMAHLK